MTARGNERKAIFRDDRDRTHFVELLSDWPERFRLRLHAYVLMENHYHFLLETPEANLSRSMRSRNLRPGWKPKRCWLMVAGGPKSGGAVTGKIARLNSKMGG